MSSEESKLAIYAAFAANLLIALVKFIASAITGSSAMLSEGIHSLVDTTNQLLLLLGIKRSKRRPSKLHPFGYGMEIYFWSFIVSILVFSVGGGVAIYEGIHRIIKGGNEIAGNSIYWNLGVLIIALIFESISFYVAISEFRKNHPKGFRSALKRSKDAPTLAVIIEDSAAVVGLIIAIIGVVISYFTKNPLFDSMASLIIGILLVYVAYFLAYETKHLLIGESASEANLKIIRDELSSNNNLEYYGNIRTMHLGPDEILVVIEANFKDNFTVPEIEQFTENIKLDLKAKNKNFKYIYIETNDILKSVI